MKYKTLLHNDELYPSRQFGHINKNAPIWSDAPEFLDYSGNIELLRGNLTGVFSSSRASGSSIIKAIDKANDLAKRRQVLIGPFQSPLEKEFLRVALRDALPIVIVESRTIRNMRIPTPLKSHFENGLLCFLSPFDDKHKHRTRKNAEYRNLIAGLLSNHIIIASMEEGSLINQLPQKLTSLSYKGAIEYL